MSPPAYLLGFLIPYPLTQLLASIVSMEYEFSESFNQETHNLNAETYIYIYIYPNLEKHKSEIEMKDKGRIAKQMWIIRLTVA